MRIKPQLLKLEKNRIGESHQSFCSTYINGSDYTRTREIQSDGMFFLQNASIYLIRRQCNIDSKEKLVNMKENIIGRQKQITYNNDGTAQRK